MRRFLMFVPVWLMLGLGCNMAFTDLYEPDEVDQEIFSKTIEFAEDHVDEIQARMDECWEGETRTDAQTILETLQGVEILCGVPVNEPEGLQFGAAARLWSNQVIYDCGDESWIILKDDFWPGSYPLAEYQGDPAECEGDCEAVVAVHEYYLVLSVAMYRLWHEGVHLSCPDGCKHPSEEYQATHPNWQDSDEVWQWHKSASDVVLKTRDVEKAFLGAPDNN